MTCFSVPLFLAVSMPPSSLAIQTAEPVLGATGFSQPDSTTEEEKLMEGEAEDADGEPNAAELRRRRLRKLETTPPLDH